MIRARIEGRKTWRNRVIESRQGVLRIARRWKQTESKPPASSIEQAAATTATPKPAGTIARPWLEKFGPVGRFIIWFDGVQTRNPLKVQLCTSSITYFCGDLAAQNIGGEAYDPYRTLRMVTIGFISSIPGYKWFMFLGRSFNYNSKVLSIATKVVVQQAVFTPIFNTWFFGAQALLTGRSPSGILQRIRETVPTSIVNSMKFWPAVTAFSFYYIRPQYRFMFSGIFAVVWQTYLSFLNRKSEKGMSALGNDRKGIESV